MMLGVSMGQESKSISCSRKISSEMPVILLHANTQDLPNAIKPQKLGNRLKLNSITNWVWQVQGACATTGDGLYGRIALARG
jgi:hypothetical protein